MLLERKHDRAGFACGTHAALDIFLQQQALQEMRRSYSVTRVLLRNDARTVVGYYSLSSTSVPLERVPMNLGRKLPQYPHVPATLLARLAVDHRYQRQGNGLLLLIDALFQAYTTGSQSIGAAAVIVDAIDEDAVRFYRKYGFQSFADREAQLYLPMATVRDMLRQAQLAP